MTRILAVTNQKGGVGKTTTCVNLAAALAARGRKVLLIDLDPQGNATTGSGVDKHALERSGYELLMGQAELPAVVRTATAGGFDLVGANQDLTAAEVELFSAPLRERRLKLALDGRARHYDCVMIDCPPSLNMLTLNALVAADGVLIPMQCEFYALEGLSALLNTVEQIRAGVNPGLRIEGVLRTLYDGRNRLTEAVARDLDRYFGAVLFNAVIPRNVRLAEAPSHGLPGILYDPGSRGAQAYIEVADELWTRIGSRRAQPEPA